MAYKSVFLLYAPKSMVLPIVFKGRSKLGDEISKFNGHFIGILDIQHGTHWTTDFGAILETYAYRSIYGHSQLFCPPC